MLRTLLLKVWRRLKVSPKKIILYIVMYGALAFIVYKAWGCWQGPPPTPPPKLKVNYTGLICDEAYKSQERHDSEITDHLDIKLGDGCFSGFVSLPRAWKMWQVQLLGKDQSDWAAIWCAGQFKPSGPFSYEQFNLQTHALPCLYQMRLQGKGTLRFFDVPANDSAPARAVPPTPSTSPAPDVAPIPKEVGPAIEQMSGAIRFGFYHCLIVADSVLCRGYARSEYNVERNFAIYSQETYLSDEAGNRYPATHMTLVGKDCYNCYDKILPKTVMAFSVTFKGVPAATHATLALKHIGFDGDQITEVDLPIDK